MEGERVTLNYRGDGGVGLFGPSMRGAPPLGRGRRVFVGGEDDILGGWKHSQERKEVLIPPEKCVYYWLGCEDARSQDNYCESHYQENAELEAEYAASAPARERNRRVLAKREQRADIAAGLIPKPSPRKARGTANIRAAHQRGYYERHKEELNRKRREDRLKAAQNDTWKLERYYAGKQAS